MALSIGTNLVDNSLVLSLHGSLNEYSSALNEIDVHPSLDLRLDLRRLEAINSVGVRNFHGWIEKIRSPRIILENCPRSFVHQLNLIDGFMPERTEIYSFFVPFYSEKTGTEHQQLFVRGQDYDVKEGKLLIHTTEVRDQNNNLMELDDINGQYFRFLQMYK